ncbi:MAG: hypothetical protein U0992_10760 [Planctomycetaceae bacterium]
MPLPPAEIERELVMALAERGAAYEVAFAALIGLQQRLHAGDAFHRLCPELQHVLEGIRHTDDRFTNLQEQWQQLSRTPGSELAKQLVRHQQQLEHSGTGESTGGNGHVGLCGAGAAIG